MFIYNNEKQNKKWVAYKLNNNIMINEKRRKNEVQWIPSPIEEEVASPRLGGVSLSRDIT